MSAQADRLETLAARSPARGAEAQRLRLDTGAVLFELGAPSALWSYDGVRPQLRFTFDAGQAVAVFQDTPARGVSCVSESFMLLSPGMRVRIRHEAPFEILSLTYAPDALAGRVDLSAYIAAIADHLPIATVDPGVRALAVEARRAHHIESNLDSKITVQELAELAGLSTAHFARAFRQATGEAPHHFILTRRIARVRALLRDPDLNLATVSFRAGFSSHAHMTSVFRRLTGLAPAAYRTAVARRLAS